MGSQITIKSEDNIPPEICGFLKNHPCVYNHIAGLRSIQDRSRRWELLSQRAGTRISALPLTRWMNVGKLLKRCPVSSGLKNGKQTSYVYSEGNS